MHADGAVLDTRESAEFAFVVTKSFFYQGTSKFFILPILNHLFPYDMVRFRFPQKIVLTNVMYAV